MNGRILRGRVNDFTDVLTDVEAEIEKHGVFDAETQYLIQRMKDDCEDLFYRIPLEGKDE